MWPSGPRRAIGRGSAELAQTNPALPLEQDQVETRRPVVAEDGGEQGVRLAAVVGLVVEEMVERRRQRLFDQLRVGDGLVAQRAGQPLLIEAVAGLALLGSLASSLQAALLREEERLPAIVTFVTAASGTAFFGIGSAFWALLAGGALLALGRVGKRFGSPWTGSRNKAGASPLWLRKPETKGARET